MEYQWYTIQFEKKQSLECWAIGDIPSGLPCPINLAFRPVCSRASTIFFRGIEPRTLTTWLLKSASTFFTPEVQTLLIVDRPPTS